LTLRLMKSTELDRVDRLMMLAYAMPSRRAELELYHSTQPDGWVVVERDGELVAAAGCIAYGSFAWLGLVATDPTVRRQGLGTRLSRYLVDWAQARGCQTVALDASEAGRRIYGRLGFATVGSTIELARGPSLTTDDTTAVTALSAAEKDELITFDRTIFGADRGALLARLLDSCASGYVRRYEGRVTGYLFARERLLGPGGDRSCLRPRARVRRVRTGR